MPPDPKAWRLGANLTAAQFHNEHLTEAFEDSSIHYWHVQTITIAEFDATMARGLWPGAGLELLVPVRLIRSRIRYEDLSRQAYTLVYPDGHHRNETPVRLADPILSLHLARAGEVWSAAGRIGFSIPVGKTEPNPFALGRVGLPHEHFQFGSGTWDPVISAAIGHEFGRGMVSAGGYAHLVFTTNSHGYEAGNRYDANITVTNALGRVWGVSLAADMAREEAEHWDGRLEEEGNLGRTDVLLSFGIGRPLGGLGALMLTVGVPIYSEALGEQGVQPPVFSLSWSDPTARP